MTSNNINDIKREIKDALVELSTPEYAEFMRELSFWAEEEANLAEYEPDYSIEEE